MGVVVVTDSSSDLSSASAREYGIDVVPLWIVFGSERLRDGVDIQRSTFYSRLAAAKDLPHTEPIDEDTFSEIFARHVAAGHDVVAPVLSEKLSETHKNALAAARKFPGRVHVVDSQTFSGGLFLHALAAAELAKAGKNAAEIAKILEAARASQHGYFITPDLSYLGRTGRLNKAVVALGTMLKVNPVLRIQNGIVDSAAQTRTFDKAQELLVDIAARELRDASKTRFMVGHANSPEHGALELAALREKLGSEPRSLMLYEAGPTVALHGGPGSLGIFSLVA
ncbi:MAG: DegV family protein [Vulcanimicrobiaceae bacterium]